MPGRAAASWQSPTSGAMGFSGQRPPALPYRVYLSPYNLHRPRAVFGQKRSVGRMTLKTVFQAKLALASML